MGLLKKSLFGLTGLGVLALIGSQTLGTVTSLSLFDHMIQTAGEQQVKTLAVNSKFAEALKEPKYQEVIADPYFKSQEFTAKNATYAEGDKAYDTALHETLKDLKDHVVNKYPLTQGAFNQMKDVVTKHIALDMENYGKFRMAKDAEDSCNPSMDITNPQAIELGKKYFCP